jgi:sulfur carrier protein
MILVNGSESELAPGSSVRELLELLGSPQRGIAVAIDSEVVPRGEWDTFKVPDGATVEVLTAVQGG